MFFYTAPFFNTNKTSIDEELSLSLKSLFTRGEISREVRGYHGELGISWGVWGYHGTLGDITGCRGISPSVGDITGRWGYRGGVGGYHRAVGISRDVGDVTLGDITGCWGISRRSAIYLEGRGYLETTLIVNARPALNPNMAEIHLS